MSSIAEAMGRAPANFTAALRSRKPQAPLLTDFARALGFTKPSILRALSGTISPADEQQISQRICSMFMARSALFEDDLVNIANKILAKQSVERRREILSRFSLADQGIDDTDPIDILSQQLGLRLNDYRKRDVTDKQRKAYAGLLLMRRSLGITAQAWADIEKVLDPYMKPYCAWRADQQLQASLQPEGQQLQEIQQKIAEHVPELRERIDKTKTLTPEINAEASALQEDFATMTHLTEAVLKKSQDPHNSASHIRREQKRVEQLLKAFQSSYKFSIGQK